MKLTPEQTNIVAGWVAAGDGLGAIQKKLADDLKISMTYMDVRFLVDDLNLSLKDPAPKVDVSDVSKAVPKAAPAQPEGEAALPEDELPPDGMIPTEPAPAGAPVVTVEVDKVTLIPGAMASGTVNFPGGITGKWIVDNQGRPALTDVSQPGYKPSQEIVQAFMQELSTAFQSRGY
jgi:hypothetical protein